MNRILTGIKPTNKIHIGNFFGTIQTIQNLEKENTNPMFIFSADLHSLTTGHINKSNALLVIKFFMATLEKNHIYYLQSNFPQITEIAWFLTCAVPTGMLHRMTQYKSLADKHEVNAGYLYYPILQAADILSLDANLVPIGIDQKQHLELTRNVAETFNQKFGQSFILPEPLIAQIMKIKDLQNNNKKMSKSSESNLGTLFLDDDEAIIIKKIKKAKTDSELMPLNIKLIESTRPEIYNLCHIFSGLTNQSFSYIENLYGNKYTSIFKNDLCDITVDFINNIKEKMQHISDGDVELVLKKNQNIVNNLLNQKLEQLKKILFI